jgi:hypothetical protein
VKFSDSTSDYRPGPQNAFSCSEEMRLAKQMQPTLYMTVVKALITESLENISALVKNFPRARQIQLFSVRSTQLLVDQGGTGTSVYAYRPHRIDHLHKEL